MDRPSGPSVEAYSRIEESAFAPGDYGPSGEDVISRFTLGGVVYVPGGFELTTLFQAESARPITLTTPVDVNGLGEPIVAVAEATRKLVGGTVACKQEPNWEALHRGAQRASRGR